MTKTGYLYSFEWSDVEACLANMAEVDGGYSQAIRGIVTMPDGNEVFVKIGTDESTKKWAKKEIETYKFLSLQNYPYIPKLLALNSDESGFAIDALTQNSGWDWTNNWTDERLNKTLEAMDKLAAIKPGNEYARYFSITTIDETSGGWGPLSASKEAQKILLVKLRQNSQDEIVSELDFTAQAHKSNQFKFHKHTLVHNDARADNCAWNLELQQVKLVDWNWAQIADRRIDDSAMLVNVQKSGMAVLPEYRNRLDYDALLWLAGFWLYRATQPLWPGAPNGSTLRQDQLQSGIIAFNLASRIQ